jgi:transcriptional regulator with XRE-family HTH domain
MSQDDLADIVGTSRKAVSRYEIGINEMGITTFFQYADALNERPEKLFPARLCERAEQTKAEKLKAIAERLSEDDLDMLLMMADHLEKRKN